MKRPACPISLPPAWLRFRPGQAPFWLEARSSPTFVTATVAVAIFTDIFLYAVVVPVVPFALGTRAHVPERRIQHWVSVLVAIYGAGCVAASPVCGWFADRARSRRLPLLLGLLALAGATLMLNVGSTIAVWVVGRTLQGISAAVVWTVGLALMVDTIGNENIGQYMGYVGIAMSVAVLLGPLLGGIVFDSGGYDAVFAMQYALIALDIAMRFLLVEAKVAAQWIKPEAPPTETEPTRGSARTVPTCQKTNGIPGPASAEADESGASSPTHSHASIVVPATLRRLPPVLALLGSRRLLSAMWGVFVVAALLTTFDAVLPLFVHETFGWGSLGAGLVFIALVVPSFVGPLVGWLADRYGPRWILTVGFASCVPWLVMLRLVDHNSAGQKVLLCTLLALTGLGFSMVMTPIMAEVSYTVEAKERAATRRGLQSPFGPGGAYAQAYALFNTAYSAGMMAGPFWAGFVKQGAGWNTMTWTLAVLSALGAIPTAIWAGGSVRKVGYSRARSGSMDTA